MPTDLERLAGMPDLVEEDASNLRMDATRLGVMQEQLAALRIDGSGFAVEGLQARITEAAGLVQEVFEHYVGAYRALEGYFPELKAAQREFDEALARRAEATADAQTSEDLRRGLAAQADSLRASAVPEAAIGQIEYRAMLAASARDRAQDAVAGADRDLDAARRRYDEAAEVALEQLRLFDTLCIDTGAYLDEMLATMTDAELMRSVVSSTGTADQREADGWFDPEGLAAQSILFGGSATAAGSTWVHSSTRTVANGTVRWSPTQTWNFQQTGVLSPTVARSLSGVYGPTGRQAIARVPFGPRAATVVSRSVGVLGAAWTLYDVAGDAESNYWYLAPEDRQAWAVMEGSAVAAGSLAAGTAGAAGGVACGPLVVACSPAFALGASTFGGGVAKAAFDSATKDDRLALAIDHFTNEHPGTSVRDGRILYEGQAIGYFAID